MVRIFDSGECVEVTPVEWEIIEFTVVKGKIEPVVIGSFAQYPFILAWAVTIHKSQGKTFDKVLIDLGRGAFAEGQTYVALSRSTSLEGITLKEKIKLSDIKTDETINKFFAKWAYEKSESIFSMQDKIDFLQQAIVEEQEVQMKYINYRNDEFDFAITPKKIYESELNGHRFTALDVRNHSLREDKTYIVEHIIELEAL